MSHAVVYLHRAARGAAITGVTFITSRGRASWSAPQGVAGATPARSIEAAASWTIDQLTQAAGDPELTLCLDLDGARCSWISAPSTDEHIVLTHLRNARAGQADNDETQHHDRASWLGAMEPGEDASAQPLAPQVARPARQGRFIRSRSANDTPAQAAPKPADAPERTRMALAAIPDLAARLFLDQLDSRGITPRDVLSLWHAMPLAWTTEPGETASRAAPIASTAPIAVVQAPAHCQATVLIDPSTRRLIWAWSRGNLILATGSMLLRTADDPASAAQAASTSLSPQATADASSRADTRPPGLLPARDFSDVTDLPRAGDEPVRSAEPSTLEVSRPDLGRLVNEWLAWSAQLGISPTRIVVAAPRVMALNLGDFDALGGAPRLAGAIDQAWGGASGAGLCNALGVDEDDPVAATLRRAVQTLNDTLPSGPAAAKRQEAGAIIADPRASMLDLSRRPGRISRTVYQWWAISLVAASICLAAIGWWLFRAADDATAQGQRAASDRAEILAGLAPIVRVPETEPDPRGFLDRWLVGKRKDRELLVPQPPILEEFVRVMRTLQQVTADGGIAELRTLQLASSGLANTITLAVSDADLGPRFEQAINRAPARGSRITWTGSTANVPPMQPPPNAAADPDYKPRNLTRGYRLSGNWSRVTDAAAAGTTPAKKPDPKSEPKPEPKPDPVAEPKPTPAPESAPVAPPASGPVPAPAATPAPNAPEFKPDTGTPAAP